ncbi:hypothetical protein DGWBC_1657 [Dehalogenimonas sp. WBC-2]|nr:hypothetical protein DGWBC_1657 [Dehalogenimonas sp. WBC-2]
MGKQPVVFAIFNRKKGVVSVFFNFQRNNLPDICFPVLEARCRLPGHGTC